MDGCILWGAQVVVPPPGRKAVLEELHETHLGANKMKALARGYIWWPKMDEDIEEVAKCCSRPLTTKSPTSFMGMAITIVEQTIFRFCWTIYGTHVFGHSRYPFKMVRRPNYALYYNREDHREALISFCHSCTALTNSYRQWHIIYQ